MNHEPRVFVRVPKWVIPRWWLVAYLVPPMLAEAMTELVETPPDERFERLVADHVHALVKEGKEPPAAIAPAIMNLADDMLAGRQMTVRTGDYIALQNYLRRQR